MSQQNPNPWHDVVIDSADAQRLIDSNATVGKPPVELWITVDRPGDQAHGTMLRIRAENVRVIAITNMREFDAEILNLVPGSKGTADLVVGARLEGAFSYSGIPLYRARGGVRVKP